MFSDGDIDINDRCFGFRMTRFRNIYQIAELDWSCEILNGNVKKEKNVSEKLIPLFDCYVCLFGICLIYSISSIFDCGLEFALFGYLKGK